MNPNSKATIEYEREEAGIIGLTAGKVMEAGLNSIALKDKEI